MFKMKQVKNWILLIVMAISIGLMGFLIYQNATKPTIKINQDDFKVKIVPIDEEDNNLKPEIIFNAFNLQILSQSILIKPTLLRNNNQAIVIVHDPIFDSKLLEFYFLQQFIKVLPQWKQNCFQFSYDKPLKHAWIKYSNEHNLDYLNWYLAIIR